MVHRCDSCGYTWDDRQRKLFLTKSNGLPSVDPFDPISAPGLTGADLRLVRRDMIRRRLKRSILFGIVVIVVTALALTDRTPPPPTDVALARVQDLRAGDPSIVVNEIEEIFGRIRAAMQGDWRVIGLDITPAEDQANRVDVNVAPEQQFSCDCCSNMPSDTPFTNDDLAYVASLKSARSLKLERTQVTDEGLRLLAEHPNQQVILNYPAPRFRKFCDVPSSVQQMTWIGHGDGEWQGEFHRRIR